MVETNYLWLASYLHEMLGSYVEKMPGTRKESHLYEETLLAAHIVELGIRSFDDRFLEFIEDHPDTEAFALYQVVRRFPDKAVRNGAALMIERLTTAEPGNGLLSLMTGVFKRSSTEAGVRVGLEFRPEIRPGIR